MNALQVAAKVAAHPVIVRMRAQQAAMVRQFQRDYGDNFMVGGMEMPDMTFANGRKSPRFAGVHYWTPAQRKAYERLTAQLSYIRTQLRNAYAAV